MTNDDLNFGCLDPMGSDPLPDDGEFVCACGQGPIPDKQSPSPKDLLDGEREPAPNWLGRADKPNAKMLRECLSSRTVFYPGSGTDGQAMKMFCSSHAAHCVIHADLEHEVWSADVLIAALGSVRGYSLGTPLTMTLEEVIDVVGFEACHPCQSWDPKPYHDPKQPLRFALVVLLHRETGFNDDHGPEQLAFIHFAAEAVWVYWNLWVRRPRFAPYAVVLQDHWGWGGNWTTFGCRQGALYGVAQKGILPEWLLVARKTCPWPGYKVASAWSEQAGEGGFRRRLMRRAVR